MLRQNCAKSYIVTDIGLGFGLLSDFRSGLGLGQAISAVFSPGLKLRIRLLTDIESVANVAGACAT